MPYIKVACSFSSKAFQSYHAIVILHIDRPSSSNVCRHLPSWSACMHLACFATTKVPRPRKDGTGNFMRMFVQVPLPAFFSAGLVSCDDSQARILSSCGGMWSKLADYQSHGWEALFWRKNGIVNFELSKSIHDHYSTYLLVEQVLVSFWHRIFRAGIECLSGQRDLSSPSNLNLFRFSFFMET